MSVKVAQDAVEAVTHLDLAFLAALLLVALYMSVKHIINTQLKLIDQKIINNENDITNFRKDCEDYIKNYAEKFRGVEAMVASAGMRVQKLQSSVDSTKAVQAAHMDRTDKDIDKLETRLSQIEETIKANHTELTKGLNQISQNVAVLISKSEINK